MVFAVEGETDADAVGTGVAVIGEFTGDATTLKHEVLIGAPGATSGGADPVDGVVKLITRSGLTGTYRFSGAGGTPLPPANVLLTFTAKDAVEAGTDAQSGFGSFLLGLGGLGTYDALGTPFLAQRYILIANTNIAHGPDSNTPEYFIYGVRCDPAPTCESKLVKHVTGTAGSMLGGFAKPLPDINGDGIVDFAISQPGGTGQLGLTGQVQIMSGKGMTTPDEDDDLLQVLYNPDPSASNFGSSIEYADMTGDGVPDFIIGADEFDSPSYLDAGAVYVFEMSAVK
jgi:hypothetical protein